MVCPIGAPLVFRSSARRDSQAVRLERWMMAPAMILIAGFGDSLSVFDPLLQTQLAQAYRLAAIDLPGFGAPPLRGRTTLQRLAEFVDAQARHLKARTVLAHSVASIIASLAALRAGSPIDTILSLEGNLTADDAYFSGMAAAFDGPDEFRPAFLARLAAMARTGANIEDTEPQSKAPTRKRSGSWVSTLTCFRHRKRREMCSPEHNTRRQGPATKSTTT